VAIAEQVLDISSYKWTCKCCGVEKIGFPPALAFGAPDAWRELDQAVRDSSNIDDDFCLVEKPDGTRLHYIRCVMELPLILSDNSVGEFQFGVWMSVSERSWNIYQDGYDTENFAEEGCFGYLSNQISAYPDSFNLPADVYFRKEGWRPLVLLHNGPNALIFDQQNGMRVEVLESLLSNMKH
jgi:hypothetical protein